jgi:hypothetical protein
VVIVVVVVVVVAVVVVAAVVVVVVVIVFVVVAPQAYECYEDSLSAAWTQLGLDTVMLPITDVLASFCALAAAKAVHGLHFVFFVAGTFSFREGRELLYKAAGEGSGM